MGRYSEFGKAWWSRRWLETLEDMGWSSRLQRGRSYARQGNVLSVSVGLGTIQGRVQGSRRTPYRVSVDVKILGKSDWDKAVTAMASSASFAAELLAGAMPRNIEEAFSQCRASLFPSSAQDLRMACSCPDWAVPCKHVAAVLYALAVEFDLNPFLLFELRGRTREQLLEELREKRRGTSAAEMREESAVGSESGAQMEALKALVLASPQSFWTGDPRAVAAVPVDVARSAVPLALIERLGVPETWPRNGRFADGGFMEIMRSYYDAAAEYAMALAYAEAGGGCGADSSDVDDDGRVDYK